MIELIDINKNYIVGENKINVLKDVNFKVEKGDFIAIMGPSGSGKSTLMNILGCLDKPSSGLYLLNSQSINDLEDKELAKIRNQFIGFVFQDSKLLARLSALKNVQLPLVYAGNPTKIRVGLSESALRSVGLSDKFKSFPNELSGGQKQRVAIARAIVNSPEILLADEPTGALDSVTTREIMSLFRELNNEGKTIIIITHDYEVAEYAKKVFKFKDGEIV